ncbi:aldo/keto reductase [Acidaminococcus fermentans DSM 20731]|uniref:2,5-didehydrogluconate reductase n=1 Tax=Acidaminococcus fermentans (strain ATCC 25085 / DSM 20731 / CCUG 9996 / CIP 106432 / VR4) TaxID=591001 RepID=D2RIM6_ACIFV|nr:aldo/keto reductase [Acidaminococcus fermentans]ADB46928.1 2,5-didehydrogluconate reductase [Acidaminococcus fermentans DSM 20731]UEA72473.1 aldo/keto reductase [Acidaminococcus fermentans DSM 20731]
MEFVTLNNGVKMPQLGYGVYQTRPEETEKAVGTALELGYRLIDTAASYGNEEGVGAAIKQSGIPRKDLFVTTKLWVQDHGYDNTLKAFDTSMKKLGLDYLDLYLIHKPYSDYYGSWRAMERLYREGHIRAIGVTSFWNERLADLFNCNEIKPAVNQIETNVWNQKWAEEAFMKQQGIQQEAWAPFTEGANHVFTNPVLQEIARKHGKTTGQVMLRWLLQRGIVVIPKSVHKERMQENLDVFDFQLDEADMQAIRSLDTKTSPIYDEMDPQRALFIGKMKIHD